MIAAATLNGIRATNAKAYIPKWGAWFVEISLDGEHTLSGAVEVKIADLTLKGTILSGGPAKGRSDFRVVAGAGGWGKSVSRKGEANDAGVKLANILRDVAQSVGETLDFGTINSDARVGPAFARIEGPASLVLEEAAPRAWHIGEDGITRLGYRAPSTLAQSVTHGPVDRALGTVTLAAESIARILPGIVVDGLTAVDVVHEISAKGGLRSQIWGSVGNESRDLDALRAVFEQLDPNRIYRGITEYRVVSQAGKRLNLQTVRVSTGMPDLLRVPMRPGVSGSDVKVALGSRVLVAFIDADPGRPCVTQFEAADGEGFTPLESSLEAVLMNIDADTFVKIGAGVKPVLVAGDLAGGFLPVAPTQLKVLA